MSNHHHVIGNQLNLAHEMRGHQNRPFVSRQISQQSPEPQNPTRIQAIRWFVKDKTCGIAQKGSGNAQSLFHAKGEGPDALTSGIGQPYHVKHIINAAARYSIGERDP